MLLQYYIVYQYLKNNLHKSVKEIRNLWICGFNWATLLINFEFDNALCYCSTDQCQETLNYLFLVRYLLLDLQMDQ